MESKVRYEVLGLRFALFGEQQEHVAEVAGRVRMAGYKSNSWLTLAPRADGEWQVRDLRWQHPPLQVLQNRDFIQQIANRCAKFLYTTNMWPTSQGEGGAQIALNQKVIPSEFDDRVIVSYRHDMLAVPSANWSLLWDQIERRLRFDPFFRVLGFDHETVVRVIPKLAQIFPAAWVKARFLEAGLREMAGPIEPSDDGFFPAYHLARAAHGAICRDPGWNYLVEIGLALERLQGVAGLDRLKGKLAASPGTQHHLCLAAELHQRGLLTGLEPPTGAGGASSDLLVSLSGHDYQVEVKEFSSQNPLRSLRRELADKAAKLPGNPAHPVVFHVVFRETGAQDVQIEREFFGNIAEITGEIPPKISAVVAGRRFVDSLGGPIKRDIEVVLVNDQAIAAAEEEHLREIFKANYEEAHMPYYGLASLFVFGEQRGEEAIGEKR